MSTALDLASLAAQGELKIPIARGVVSQGASGTDYTGWSGVSSVFVEAKVEVREQSRGFATLTLTIEGSSNGSDWSTLETFTFGHGGSQSATVSSPPDHLRVSWAVGGGSEWQIIEVTAAPSVIDLTTNVGSLPDPITTPVTIDNGEVGARALTVDAEHDTSPRDAGAEIAAFRMADGTVVAKLSAATLAGDATDGTLFVGPGIVNVRMAGGESVVFYDADNDHAVLQVDSGGGLFVRSPETGAGLDVTNVDGSSHTFTVYPAFEGGLIWLCNFVARIMNGVYFTSASTPPADDDLSDGEMGIYFDPTPGATKLKIKAKDSGGTIRTGSVNLT